jgi:phospholipid transport system substrate-binding protein
MGPNPEDVISTITQEILSEIKNDPSLVKGDLESINLLVEKKVMPILDFEKMTALSVGAKWRQASDIQREELQKAFRRLLLLSYSGTVKFAEKAKVKILPPRRKKNDSRVVVKTRVSVPGRQAVPVDYRMRLTDEGWKIYDLNVLGLWLVDNYRVQFSQIVGSKGVDGLINEIVKKNNKLSKKSNL